MLESIFSFVYLFLGLCRHKHYGPENRTKIDLGRCRFSRLHKFSIGFFISFGAKNPVVAPERGKLIFYVSTLLKICIGFLNAHIKLV